MTMSREVGKMTEEVFERYVTIHQEILKASGVVDEALLEQSAQTLRDRREVEQDIMLAAAVKRRIRLFKRLRQGGA
jgi:hypothetical protein